MIGRKSDDDKKMVIECNIFIRASLIAIIKEETDEKNPHTGVDAAYGSDRDDAAGSLAR